MQTILRSYLVQSHIVNEFRMQRADVTIEPDVSKFKLTEFARTSGLAQVGHEATIRAMSETKKQSLGWIKNYSMPDELIL